MVTITLLDLGSVANDGTGTPLRDGGDIIDDNFTALAAVAGVTAQLEAAEDLAPGDPVNLVNVGGQCVMQKADATAFSDGKDADGFVKAAVLTGDTGTYFGAGIVNDGLSGLTPGDVYWLAAGGGVTHTMPTTTGAGQQRLGKALSATQLAFQPGVMNEAP